MSSKRFRIQMMISDGKKGPEADVLTDITVVGVGPNTRTSVLLGLRWRTFGDRQLSMTVKHLLRLSGKRLFNTLHDWAAGCYWFFSERKRAIVKY